MGFLGLERKPQRELHRLAAPDPPVSRFLLDARSPGLSRFFEIITWAQLGLHSKPIGLLNISSYFEPLLALIAHAAAEGFVPAYHAYLLLSEETPNKLLERFYNFTPPAKQQKWTEIPPER